MTMPQLFGNVLQKWWEGDGRTIKYELFLLKLKFKNPNILKLFLTSSHKKYSFLKTNVASISQ